MATLTANPFSSYWMVQTCVIGVVLQMEFLPIVEETLHTNNWAEYLSFLVSSEVEGAQLGWNLAEIFGNTNPSALITLPSEDCHKQIRNLVKRYFCKLIVMSRSVILVTQTFFILRRSTKLVFSSGIYFISSYKKWQQLELTYTDFPEYFWTIFGSKRL